MLFEWGLEDDHRTLKSGFHLQLCVDHICARHTQSNALSNPNVEGLNFNQFTAKTGILQQLVTRVLRTELLNSAEAVSASALMIMVY